MALIIAGLSLEHSTPKSSHREVKIRALVDTGSPISLVNRKLALQLHIGMAPCKQNYTGLLADHGLKLMKLKSSSRGSKQRDMKEGELVLELCNGQRIDCSKCLVEASGQTALGDIDILLGRDLLANANTRTVIEFGGQTGPRVIMNGTECLLEEDLTSIKRLKTMIALVTTTAEVAENRDCYEEDILRVDLRSMPEGVLEPMDSQGEQEASLLSTEDREGVSKAQLKRLKSLVMGPLGKRVFGARVAPRDIPEDDPIRTMRIQLKDKMKCSRQFPIPMDKEKTMAIELMIGELLEAGIIEQGTWDSQYVSRLFLVKKKRERPTDPQKWRLVQDFRPINENTKKEFHDFPTLSQIYEKVGGKSRYTSKADLAQGFYQMGLSEESRKYTTFWVRTSTGELQSYQWKSVSMGLLGSPIAFQRRMELLLLPAVKMASRMRNAAVIVYLDDVLVSTSEVETHLQLLEEVLRCLAEEEFRLSPAKCDFLRTKMMFLGSVWKQGVRSPDPAKLRAIQDFPLPSTRVQLDRFLGMASWLRGHVNRYAGTTAPLYAMPKGRWPRARQGGQSPVWTRECKEAFRKTKEALLASVDLHLPDRALPLLIDADASDIAIGSVCRQWRGDKLVYLGHFSRKLTEAEQRRPIYEREFLSIAGSLHAYRDWLLTSTADVRLHGRHEVRTDHKPLLFLWNQESLTAKQRRWVNALSVYDFKVTYLEGEKNVVADALSRLPQYERTPDFEHRREDELVDFENESRTLHFTDQSLIAFSKKDPVTSRGVSEAWEKEHAEEMRAAYRASRTYGQVVQDLEEQGDDSKYTKMYRLDKESGLLWYRAEDPIPRTKGPSEIRRLVVAETAHRAKHDLLDRVHKGLGRLHPGAYKMYVELAGRVRWPGLLQDCTDYVKTCPRCLRLTKYQSIAPLLKPISDVTVPRLAVWHVDYMTSLPPHEKYGSIMTCIDRATRFCVSIALPKEAGASVVIEMIERYIVGYFGTPQVVAGDRDSRHLSREFKDWAKGLGIKEKWTCSNHAQADGLVERCQKSVSSYLRVALNSTQSNWPEVLPFAMYTYNSSFHKSVNTSPYFSLFGFHPYSGLDEVMGKSSTGREVEELEPGELTREDAQRVNYMMCQEALVASTERMVRYQAWNKKKRPMFNEGQMVYCHKDALTPPISRLSVKRKWTPTWSGPYRVVRFDSDRDVVQLELPPAFRAHNVISAMWIKSAPLVRREFKHDPEPEGVWLGDGEDAQVEFKVDKIITHHRSSRNGPVLFEIKWEGYDEFQNSYEPVRNLVDSDGVMLDRLSEYLEAHPEVRGMLPKKYRKKLQPLEGDGGSGVQTQPEQPDQKLRGEKRLASEPSTIESPPRKRNRRSRNRRKPQRLDDYSVYRIRQSNPGSGAKGRGPLPAFHL